MSDEVSGEELVKKAEVISAVRDYEKRHASRKIRTFRMSFVLKTETLEERKVQILLKLRRFRKWNRTHAKTYRVS